jgi:hypothetical protein
MNRLDLIDEITANIGRIFLGVNLDCISCHDGAGHTDNVNLFLTDRKRAEFHRQAAFFGNLRSISEVATKQVIDDSGPGYTTGDDAPFYTAAEARFPRDGRTYEPAFILTGETPRPGENPRFALGRILPSHIQFSRAAVNLIWGKLMVAAFVEPFDGFDLNRLDPNNPPPAPWTLQPTNPLLLEAMAKDFQQHNYSLHHLFKTVMKSSAYQLSTRFPAEWKDAYAPYYARRFVRVLSGPEVADALAQATNRPYEFNVMGNLVGRVKQLGDPNPNALAAQGARPIPGAGGRTPSFTAPSEGISVGAIMQAFFQSTRETPSATANRVSAIQGMLMMSSPAVTNRVRSDSGSTVQQLLESGKTDAGIVEELFLRTLSRFPRQAETEVALRILSEGDRKQRTEDLHWILLNTAEFLLNR